MLGNAGNTADTIAGLLRSAFDKNAPPPPRLQAVPAQTPASDQINSAASAIQAQNPGFVTPQQYLRDRPQSKGQEYARAIGQGVAATLTGGGVEGGFIPTTQRLAIGGASGASSLGAGDIAGAATEKVAPEAAPAARATASVLGGIVPAFIGGGVFGGPPAVDEQIARLTPSMTEDEINAVVNRMKANEAVGFPTTGPETTDTITNNASRLGSLQRSIETKPAGIEHIGRMMAQRPARAQSIMAEILDNIGAPTNDRTALNAQEAAQDVLSTAEHARTSATHPMYQAAEDQPADPRKLAQFLAQSNEQIAADNTGLLTRPVRDMRDRVVRLMVGNDGQVTVPTVGDLSTIKQRFGALAELPLGTVDGLDRRQAGALSHGVNSLAEVLAENPQHAAADANFAQISRDTVDPLFNGPMGTIARPFNNSGEPRLQTQINALFPKQPFENQDISTGEAVGQLGQSGADLTRAYLAQQAGTHITDANQTGPARFAAALGAGPNGNPIRRDTVQGAVSMTTPDSGQHFARALDAFQTSGARYPIGSPTVDKMEEELQTAGEKLGIAELAGSGKRLLMDRARNVFNDLQLQVRQGEIARAITSSPDEWGQFLRRAETARGNEAAMRATRQAALSLLASTSGRTAK